MLLTEIGHERPHPMLAEGDGDPVQPRPAPIASDYTRDEVPALMQGAEFSRRALYDELETVDLPSLELAEEYFASIEAPHKEFVRFEGCHHFVVINRPHDILRERVARVIPHF